MIGLKLYPFFKFRDALPKVDKGRQPKPAYTIVDYVLAVTQI